MLRAWTEERFSRSGRCFTINSAHVIPKPRQRPHPPIYQVCVSQDGRTLDQLATNRDIYVATLKKTGRSEAEVAALLQGWGVSRHIYVAPTDAQALEEPREAELWYAPEVPGPEDQHPSLQPGFRALAERLAKVTWEGLVAETLRRSGDGGEPPRDDARPGRRSGALLDALRGPAPRQGPALHGAVRPGGDAALPRPVSARHHRREGPS